MVDPWTLASLTFPLSVCLWTGGMGSQGEVQVPVRSLLHTPKGEELGE